MICQRNFDHILRSIEPVMKEISHLHPIWMFFIDIINRIYYKLYDNLGSVHRR